MGYINGMNGWVRLWVVLSVLWLAIVAGTSDWRKPGSASVQQWPNKQPDIVEIKRVWASHCEPRELATLWGFTGDMSKLLPEIMAPSNPAGAKFTPELYCAKRLAWRDKLLANIPPLFLPPLLLLIFGIAIGWIRRGFRQP